MGIDPFPQTFSLAIRPPKGTSPTTRLNQQKNPDLVRMGENWQLHSQIGIIDPPKWSATFPNEQHLENGMDKSRYSKSQLLLMDSHQ